MRNILTCMLLLCVIQLSGQEPQPLRVDGSTRSYYIKTPPRHRKRMPVVVVVPDQRVNAESLYGLPWDRLRRRVVLVFPIVESGCDSSSDQQFLVALVEQVHQMYGTDPDRVFMIGLRDSYCVVDKVNKCNPGLLRSAVRWNYGKRFLRRINSTDEHEEIEDPDIEDSPSRWCSKMDFDAISQIPAPVNPLIHQ